MERRAPDDADAPAPAPAGDGALRIPIAPRRLLCVEHPCYVINSDKAIRMLGGHSAVAARPEYLECSFRPEDPCAHPLFGVLVPTPGYLLKVTRRRRRPASASAGGADAAGPSSAGAAGPSSAGASSVAEDASTGVSASAEVVGIVEQSYRFEGLADFQYVSDPKLCAALSDEVCMHACMQT